MRNLIAAAVFLAVATGPFHVASAACVSDPVAASALQFDASYLFRGLDQSLGTQFAAWLTRWKQENATDPTPGFVAEDNCQNGLDDDDHLDLLAAILEGEPVAAVMPGISAQNISAIRASFASNRAKVRPDLTLVIIFVTVNIIDEINKDDPEFGDSLQDLVAAYMTIGDEESVRYIRGLLITLGEIFIEIGVANGDIPSVVAGLTKTTLRNTVNANFVATRYDCYGDAPGASKPNLLGDTGNIGGSALSNLAEYTAQGRDRQAWLIAKGVAKPPIEITTAPVDRFPLAGVPTSFTAVVAGGDGTAPDFDWKRVNAQTGATSPAGTGNPFALSYPIASEAGLYQLFVCDDTWIRTTLPAELVVSPANFQIIGQPQGATRNIGGSVTFSVTVRGGEQKPVYQWYSGATLETLAPMQGQNGRELILNNLQPGDAGLYQARITGGPNTAAVTLPSNAVALVVQEVADQTPPVLTLLGDTVLTLACGDAYQEPGFSAIDLVDGVLTAQVQVAGAVPTGQTGSFVITYSVQDLAGNSASVQRTVNVVDNLAPVLALIGADPLLVPCTTTFIDPGATALDTCDGAVGAVATGAVNTAVPGGYTRTYTATDAAGNSASITRTVQVVDLVAPVITRIGPASISVACGGVLNDPGATALDACAGNVTAGISVSGAVDVATPGSYTRTYTAVDPSGNSVSVNREFVVTDTQAPAITLVGANPLTVACGESFGDPGASALDACDGVLTLQIAATGAVNTAQPGSYLRTYSVADVAGNVAQVTRVVNVVDQGPPVLLLNGPEILTIPCGGTLNDPGVSAIDACGGDLGGLVQVGGALNLNLPGDYTRTYTATDASGNTASITRVIRVADAVPPVITLIGPAELTIATDCGGFTDPGASATDACVGTLNASISVVGNVDRRVPGEYTLTYSVVDTAGNSASTSRLVRVVGAPILPLLEMPEGAIAVACGGAFTPPVIGAIPACEGDAPAPVRVVGEVDTATPGTYVLTYEVLGAEEDVLVSAPLEVVVTDGEAPVLALNGAALVEVACGGAYSDLGATASDACDGELGAASLVAGAVDTSQPGDYVLTYTRADSAGNTGSIQRTVRVFGALPAAITLNGASALALSCGETYTEPGWTAVDTCGGDAAALVTVAGSVDTGRPGVYTLTYTLGIASGGPASATRQVTVLADCAITITLQPRPQALYTGMQAAFTVRAAGGSGALEYQWLRDGAPILDAVQPSYLIDAVTLDDAGRYVCRVGDGTVEAFSDEVALLVFERPATGQQSADSNGDWSISLSELLRVIQFYNVGVFSCAEDTEDGFAPGVGPQDCAPHTSDYAPQDWSINLSELLRMIQFFNTPGGAYRADETGEDGFAPGAGWAIRRRRVARA